MTRWEEPDFEAPGRDRWLLSYADFLTLLLALFVVLYAVSAVDVARLSHVAQGVHDAFSGSGSERAGLVAGFPLAESGSGRNAAGGSRGDFQFLLMRDRLEQSLAEVDGEPGGVQVRRSERGVVVSLASADFFQPGETEVQADARRTLDAIAAVLALSNRPLRVEGHTDDRPIANARHPSNWELSTSRASAVVRHLVDDRGFDPTRIAAVGYAHYRPLAPNDSEENRAANRRIDIVISNEGPADEEPDADDSLRRVLDGLPPLEDAGQAADPAPSA